MLGLFDVVLEEGDSAEDQVPVMELVAFVPATGGLFPSMVAA